MEKYCPALPKQAEVTDTGRSSKMIVVQKSVAHPWMCDVLGHMTTRFYLNMFDDASYHILYEVFGWSGASDDKGERGWACLLYTSDAADE